MEGLRTRSGSGVRHLRARERRPRSPGVAYAALTLALAALVGSLALTSRQSPPPTIAEFAPQAVEQIREAAGEADGRGRTATGEVSAIDEQAAATDAARQTVDV